MTLKELREQKITDMVDRFQTAMYENYVEGNTINVKNICVKQEGSEFGLETRITNQWFTNNELKFIEQQNVLDKIRENGWDIEIIRPIDGDFSEVEWVFIYNK